jgi:hypothetical protein
MAVLKQSSQENTVLGSKSDECVINLGYYIRRRQPG